jgi:predicted metal-dependent hydrolase
MQALLGEIRSFLHSLRQATPELFKTARPRPLPRNGDRLFHQRAALWSERMGISYKRLSVKQQRTRWGSASAKRNLNFNRRLLWAPLEVLDYVIIHELAHLREMNHSKRFWRIVAEHCPAHKEHRRWLRTHGPGLMRRALSASAFN